MTALRFRRMMGGVAVALACAALAVWRGPPAPAPPATPIAAAGDLPEPPVPEPPVPEPPPPQNPSPAPLWRVDLDGAATATRPRTAAMELAPLTGRRQRVEVRYDPDAVLRSITLEAIDDGPDWAAGVRLLLGEVGAGRLGSSRWSLLEAVGILETVNNRFQPDLANPLRLKGVAEWPGCGVGASFATCIDPQQYRGLDTPRALRPREAVPDEAALLAGVDRAALGWFVFEEALLGEITAGATSFVHLCGGAAYGRPQGACAGADALRGPITFRGPSSWLAKEGRYALETLATVDYVEGPLPTKERAYVRYLLGQGGGG